MIATVPIHKGTLTLPSEMCRMAGLEGNGQVIIEETTEGLLVKPDASAMHMYSDEEIAEFDRVNNDLGPDPEAVLAKLRALAAAKRGG